MRVAVAILASLAVHAAVFFAVALYFDHVALPEVSAALDLSSVELSFSETPDDTQAASQMSCASVPREAMPEPDVRPADPAPAADEPPPAQPPDLPAEIARADPEPEVAQLPEPPPPEPVKPPPPKPAAVASVASAPRQARVDAPPRPRRNIRPDYPRGARQRGEQGDVLLEIAVAASGSVEEVRVVTSSGYAELDAAAVRAASEARFVPAKSGGRSVASRARLTLTFKLK